MSPELFSLPYPFSGLTDQAAAAQLKKDGFNEIRHAGQLALLGTIFEILKEPMFGLLLGTVCIYFLLGDPQEAAMLLAMVSLVVGITIYQKRRTEKAVFLLKELSSPRAFVIRDGKQDRIPGREVVRNDLIFISEGDRIPADAQIVSSLNLSVDESMLTGESLPVYKPAKESVYAGTLVVKGSGFALVTVTGAWTQMGKIGSSLTTIARSKTLLQTEVNRIMVGLLGIGLATCAAVALLYGFVYNEWLTGSLFGLTLAIAMIPEEFTVVISVFTALGAWRMSKVGILVRQTSIVETLGATTVLCTDKTGTLTQNQLSIHTLWCEGSRWETGLINPVPESFHAIIEFGVLASQQNPLDPMEQAIFQFLKTNMANAANHWHPKWELVRDYPLSEQLLATSLVWRAAEVSQLIIATKGSPEAIIDLCHLDAFTTVQIEAAAKEMAQIGLRVIGVATARFQSDTNPVLPANPHDFAFEFLGLIGFTDPLRPNAAAAVAECQNAGIRVVLMTGDYPATALNVAQTIGLSNQTQVLTGAELQTLSDPDLEEKLKTVSIFARMQPAQKLRLVQILKKNDEVVAMTGDGINDAPALKAAHVGIAMGKRGTDVARETADLVLTDDNFASVVAAIRKGRHIYQNIKRSFAYIWALHIPIAGLAIIPLVVGWEPIFMPIHIVFLELITDPACSLLFEAEPEAPDLMRAPPRGLKQPIFDWPMIVDSSSRGALITMGCVAVYFVVTVFLNQSPVAARTTTYATLIVSNLTLIFSYQLQTKSPLTILLQSKNKFLWPMVLVNFTILMLILFVPALRDLFHFVTLSLANWILILVLGIGSVLVLPQKRALKGINFL